MTIEELALVAGRGIRVTFPDVDENYMYEMERAEIKEGGCLVGTVGRGKTPDQARSDYVAQIRGKTLVFDAYSKRQEVRVPEALT